MALDVGEERWRRGTWRDATPPPARAPNSAPASASASTPVVSRRSGEQTEEESWGQWSASERDSSAKAGAEGQKEVEDEGQSDCAGRSHLQRQLSKELRRAAHLRDTIRRAREQFARLDPASQEAARQESARRAEQQESEVTETGNEDSSRAPDEQRGHWRVWRRERRHRRPKGQDSSKAQMQVLGQVQAQVQAQVQGLADVVEQLTRRAQELQEAVASGRVAAEQAEARAQTQAQAQASGQKALREALADARARIATLEEAVRTGGVRWSQLEARVRRAEGRVAQGAAAERDAAARDAQWQALQTAQRRHLERLELFQTQVEAQDMRIGDHAQRLLRLEQLERDGDAGAVRVDALERTMERVLERLQEVTERRTESGGGFRQRFLLEAVADLELSAQSARRRAQELERQLCASERQVAQRESSAGSRSRRAVEQRGEARGARRARLDPSDPKGPRHPSDPKDHKGPQVNPCALEGALSDLARQLHQTAFQEGQKNE